jgi:hypothetical protein
MIAAVTPDDNRPRDLALAAIEEALGAVGHAKPQEMTLVAPKRNKSESHGRPIRAPKPVKELLSPKPKPRKLAALLAIVCGGIAVLAFQSNGEQVASEPVSTSSVPVVKKEGLRTQPAPQESEAAAKKFAETQVEALPQSARIGSRDAAAPPELTRQVQDMARDLASLAQGMDQLRTELSRIAHQNADLVEELKATRIVADRNTELAEDLRATQSQLARQISNLADQLKANQDLMASNSAQLKEAQEQVARPPRSEQRQRPRPIASSQPPAANLPRRTLPKPAPSRVQVQDQTRTQPGQE